MEELTYLTADKDLMTKCSSENITEPLNFVSGLDFSLPLFKFLLSMSIYSITSVYLGFHYRL